MARYNAPGLITTVSTTPGKQMCSITALTGATTLRRAWVYDISFGTTTAPADTFLNLQAHRVTTAGTGATSTAYALDAGDAASLMTVNLGAFSIEPTVTTVGNLLNVPLNQRASYRWVAAPGGELIVPATTANGIAVGASSAGPSYAGNAAGSTHYFE